MSVNPCTVIAASIDRLFPLREGWEHGTCMSLLTGLSVEQAMWRPAPGKRCIWEIVGHMQHWRRFVAARLAHEPGAQPGEPWPSLPETADRGELERAWRNALSELRCTHEEVLAALARLDPAEPHPRPEFAGEPHWVSALGMQIHDSYHLGQIAMLRGLQGLPAID